jgi:hypothetical protein
MLDDGDSTIHPEDSSAAGLAGGIGLLLGVVGGGTLGVIIFGLAWAAYLPSSSVVLIETLLRLGITGLFTASLGVAMTALRPIRHWTIAIVVVVLGGAGGFMNGLVLEDLALRDCQTGTGPQPEWCEDSASLRTMFISNILAGAFVAGALVPLGVRRRRLRIPDQHSNT